MAVALRILPVGKEAVRNDQVQIVLRARHRHVEQPALLLDLIRGPGAEVGGNAAVHHIEHKYRFPLLTFGGMDGREDQIILVQQRHARLIAGGIRRIEREFGEEPLAGWIARRNLFELDKVSLADRGVLMDAFEVRFVPASRVFDFGRPGRLACAKLLEGVNECVPIFARSRRCRNFWRARTTGLAYPPSVQESDVRTTAPHRV